ncbi:MAG: glycosyltransferase [Candidatus Moranbacteria bacterium]|jgi:glycosyltransferase involved in cell wall biosynthesis|nr:glycosyltransferase [Candidatus Moranbacteria bacterium]
MRILEINKYFFVKGGAERHFFDVADLLMENGHEVAFFSMQHKNNLKNKWSKYFVSTVGYTDEHSLKEKIKGVFRMFYSFEAKNKINKILDDFKPEVVHIHNIYHQLSPAILFEIKKRNIPIIMTVHDYKLVNPNYNLFHKGKIYNRCLNGKYYQCFLDKCFKNSYIKSFLAMSEAYWHNSILKTYKKNVDVFIVPSKFVKDIIVKRGVKEEKIKVLPHFAKSINKEKYQMENEEKFALCMGRISREKGVKEIVDIFRKMDGIKLYLAGSMENGFKISNVENIKHLGYLSKEELENYIQKAFLIISGSKLPETFGLVALESISQGKPFVGFNVGAYGEIIKNGENGFLVESKDEMRNVLKGILDKKIIFDKDRIKIEAQLKYDKEKYRKKIEDILREVLTN